MSFQAYIFQLTPRFCCQSHFIKSMIFSLNITSLGVTSSVCLLTTFLLIVSIIFGSKLDFFNKKLDFTLTFVVFFFLSLNMRNISSIFRSSHRKVMLPKLFHQKWDRFCKLTFAWIHRKLLFANNLFPTCFRHVETGFFVLKLELIFYFFCYNFLILNTNEFSSLYFSTHSKVLLPEPFYHKYDFFFKHHLARSYLKRLFAKNISSNSFNNLRVETRFFQQITWFHINICRFFFWNFNMRKISSIFRSSHRKIMLPKLFYQK